MAIEIRLSYDDTALFRRFKDYERKMAYGVVNAINNAAKRVQQAQFERVREEFQIRKPAYFFGTPARPGGVAARISPFASVAKGRAYADISVSAGSLAAQRRTLLPLFEQGGERKPMTPGAKRIAVPLLGRPARPSIARTVPPQFTFAQLRFAAFHRGKRLRRRRRGGKTVDVGILGEYGRVGLPESGPIQWKGKQRTFILTSSRGAPDGGVFQRFGPKRGDVRMLYKFVKPFRLESRLRWIQNAQAIAPVWLREEVQRSLIDTIQHEARKALSA